jgi:maleate isomerase
VRNTHDQGQGTDKYGIAARRAAAGHATGTALWSQTRRSGSLFAVRYWCKDSGIWNIARGEFGLSRDRTTLPQPIKDQDMPDALGPRLKLGVITPASNTIVQPEYDAMRPRGVTNQVMRVVIPDTPVGSEEEFANMMSAVRNSIEAAIDGILACSPSAIAMAMSAETFWEGVLDVNALQAHLESRSHLKVILGAQACLAAIQRYGGVRRIALITPYMPAGDAQVRRSFTDSGFEVVNLLGLKCNSPLLMAHEPLERLRRAVREVDDPSVELILQVGTNLAFSRIAAEAEAWLGKPVLAVNTCTYWHALRSMGIDDKIEGFGSLLMEH